ncbi:hypothetical protein L6164_008666 [Bauhinia variegata]|uniref:Uncharacterized protein n=1 Tax=Bauhinia variegata TaxID=167791 RepID=A0ACB9PGK6_BAUVA|nr:hypothetical protein L6164_008666 [Bauhinia variegata]
MQLGNHVSPTSGVFLVVLSQWNEQSNTTSLYNAQVQLSVPKWSKPVSPCVKINIDAAVGFDHIGGVGGVLRDTAETFLGGWCNQCDWSTSISSLEAMANREALVLLKAWGYQHIVLEGDSQSIIHQLNSPRSNMSYEGLIINDILALSKEFTYVSFSWVPREANKVAHQLVALVKTTTGCNVWWDDPPTILVNNLLIDSQ